MDGTHPLHPNQPPQPDQEEEPTMFQPTLRVASTCHQLDNPQTTATPTILPTGLSKDQASSLIPRMELASGGKLDSVKVTGSTESESSTEEIAVEEDSMVPRL